MNVLSLKRITALFPLLIIALLLIPIHSFAGQFTVTTVYDGDTVKVQGHDIIIYVLLAGIDEPEIAFQNQKGQPYAQEAKQFLERLLLNKTVDIKGYGLGPYPYNHLIGEIRLKDSIINITMIKEGLAEVCHEQPPDGLDITPYREAEREAKAAKLGMWSSDDTYVSPWKWRAVSRAKHSLK